MTTTLKTATAFGVTIELQQDRDDRYRWYESATGADTEVSGRTVEEATENAASAWSDFSE
jgi:hypothetical protein